MKEYEEYYLLMRFLRLSLEEIKKLEDFERKTLINELKKK